MLHRVDGYVMGAPSREPLQQEDVSSAWCPSVTPAEQTQLAHLSSGGELDSRLAPHSPAVPARGCMDLLDMRGCLSVSAGTMVCNGSKISG